MKQSTCLSIMTIYIVLSATIIKGNENKFYNDHDHKVSCEVLNIAVASCKLNDEKCAVQRALTMEKKCPNIAGEVRKAVEMAQRSKLIVKDVITKAKERGGKISKFIQMQIKARKMIYALEIFEKSLNNCDFLKTFRQQLENLFKKITDDPNLGKRVKKALTKIPTVEDHSQSKDLKVKAANIETKKIDKKLMDDHDKKSHMVPSKSSNDKDKKQTNDDKHIIKKEDVEKARKRVDKTSEKVRALYKKAKQLGKEANKAIMRVRKQSTPETRIRAVHAIKRASHASAKYKIVRGKKSRLTYIKTQLKIARRAEGIAFKFGKQAELQNKPDDKITSKREERISRDFALWAKELQALSDEKMKKDRENKNKINTKTFGQKAQIFIQAKVRNNPQDIQKPKAKPEIFTLKQITPLGCNPNEFDNIIRHLKP